MQLRCQWLPPADPSSSAEYPPTQSRCGRLSFTLAENDRLQHAGGHGLPRELPMDWGHEDTAVPLIWREASLGNPALVALLECF